MPKLEVGQQWMAVEIDADLRSSDYTTWAFKIVYITKHKGRPVGLGLKLDWDTRAELIEDDGVCAQCWWFRENGESFSGIGLDFRLVRPLDSNDPALRAPRFSDGQTNTTSKLGSSS